MKKLSFLVLIFLQVFFVTVFANSDSTGMRNSNVEQMKISETLDEQLVVNLQDKDFQIVKTVHPDLSGNFYFGGLVDASYSIKVVNVNGIVSESYKIHAVNGEIKASLQQVLVPDNLMPTGACFEGCTSNSLSELNLCVTPSELKDRGNVEFIVKNTSLVHIVISNTTGDNFAVLPIGEVDSGIHSVNFDASNMQGDYNISAYVGKQMSTCKVSVK